MSIPSLGPALDPQGRPLDQIALTGVSGTGHHGVLPRERAEGQLFRVDVVAHVDTRAAAAADDLTRTVDYGALATRVEAVLTGEPADLIETVAQRIADVVLSEPGVLVADVRLHKPSAPIEVPFDDVAVVIRRERSSQGRVPVRSGEEPSGEEAPARPASAEAGVPVVAPVPVGALPGAAPPDAGLPDAGLPDAGLPAEVGESGDRLDRRPEHPVDVVLALGANVGDVQVTLREAVAGLGQVRGITVTAVAPLARTAAVGGPEQPDFLNTVVLARTTLSPRELLHTCQHLEEAAGRVRTERWGPRTLDVDVIAYGTLTAVAEDLELPHPRAHERAFVLEPWNQVDPDAVLPGLGGGPVGVLADTAPDRQGVRWLALDWLDVPVPGASGTPVPQSAPRAEPDPSEDAGDLSPDPALADGSSPSRHSVSADAADPVAESDPDAVSGPEDESGPEAASGPAAPAPSDGGPGPRTDGPEPRAGDHGSRTGRPVASGEDAEES